MNLPPYLPHTHTFYHLSPFGSYLGRLAGQDWVLPPALWLGSVANVWSISHVICGHDLEEKRKSQHRHPSCVLVFLLLRHFPPHWPPPVCGWPWQLSFEARDSLRFRGLFPSPSLGHRIVHFELCWVMPFPLCRIGTGFR